MGIFTLNQRIVQPGQYPWGYTGCKGFWAPAKINTALWLDAADSSTITKDSGVVSQWTDKSGNNRHATQSVSSDRPETGALGSISTVLFDGDTFLTVSWTSIMSDSAGNASVFYVLRFHNTSVLQIPTRIDTTSTLLIHGYSSSSSNFYRISDSGWDTNTRSISSEFGDTANIVSLMKDGSNGLVHRNGSLRISKSLSENIATTGTLYIGVNGDYGGDGLIGDLAEMIVLPDAASDTNRQKIEGYLAHKWGLAASLPSDHPYKTNRP